MGNWTGEPTSYSYRWEVGGVAAGTDAATYDVQPDRCRAERHLHSDGDERCRLNHGAGIQQRARRVHDREYPDTAVPTQALRLLGVRVVPLDDSPTLTETVSTAHHRYPGAGRVGRDRLGRNAVALRPRL